MGKKLYVGNLAYGVTDSDLFTIAEGFGIDLERAESPGTERKRLELEVQHVLQEPILNLQVLRAEEGPLRPDDRLESLHLQST